MASYRIISNGWRFRVQRRVAFLFWLTESWRGKKTWMSFETALRVVNLVKWRQRQLSRPKPTWDVVYEE